MSNVRASIRSIDALKDWFLSAQYPFWTLWTGFSKDGKDLAFRQSEISDVNESWELLEKLVSQKTAGGGRVTVFITANKNTSAGYTEFLEIAAPPGAVIPGIGSPGMGGYIGGIEAYIAQQMQMYDQRREIEDLKAALEEKQTGTGINRLVNRIIEEVDFTPIIMGLAAKYLPGMSAPAVNGAPSPHRIITDDHPDNENEETQTDNQDMSENTLTDTEQERLQNALNRLAVHVPNIIDALEQLADYAEKNPALIKTFLKS